MDDMSDADYAPPAAEPVAAPVPAAGQIVVVAAVKVRGLELGVPTTVDDDAEWRALATGGLVEIVG